MRCTNRSQKYFSPARPRLPTAPGSPFANPAAPSSAAVDAPEASCSSAAVDEHDASGASTAAEEGAAGFAKGEPGAVGSRGRAGEKYFCERFVHRMPARSFIQLSKRRGGERADDGGNWDSRVARVRAINGRGQQSTVERKKRKDTVIPGVTGLGRAVDVCGGDIEERELAAGGHYVAAAGIADEGR